MKKTIAFIISNFIIAYSFSQSIALNNSGVSGDASAVVDISSTTQGLLIPRMTSAQRTALSSPATGLFVYQTDGTTGLYYNSGTSSSPSWQRIGPYWTISSTSFDADGNLVINTSITSTITSSNRAWMVGGNNYGTVGTAYNFGTTSNDHVDLVSFGTVRGRISNLGEFFWGATSTVLAGDLFNAISNTTFPFALNGYSSYNGSGVYGAIQGANTTRYAAILGENNSTTGSYNSSAVAGFNNSYTAGTGFRVLTSTGPRMGVYGSFTQIGSYSFGVHGTSPSVSTRTGAVFGDDGGIVMGAIGYYAQATLVDYSFYGFGSVDPFTTGSASGRPATSIGLGMHGNLMGGWLKGEVYGTMVKGDRYSLYVDGQTFTNQPITQLVATDDGNKIPTYTSASLQSEISVRGKGKLQEGKAFISFNAAFKQVITSSPDDLTITITPMGNSNGVYISSYDKNGFYVTENNNGTSEVAFTWIAIGLRKDATDMKVAEELLSADFEKKMDGVMSNDADPEVKQQFFWWDGKKVRYDTPPPKPKTEPAFIQTREQKKQSTDGK